jgi:hypothetical protein
MKRRKKKATMIFICIDVPGEFLVVSSYWCSPATNIVENWT